MLVGIKDLFKLLAISVVICCAAFVCTLFLNYNLDIVGIKDQITHPQGVIMYEALVASGKAVAGISGGCLIATSVLLLIFYVKNYIDSHCKELGILKALGYTDINVAKRFWVFGLSVFIGAVIGFISAFIYMPTFYEVQNKDGIFPTVKPNFNLSLLVFVIVLPTLFFILLSIFYSFFKLKRPVLDLLHEAKSTKTKIKKLNTDPDLPFLKNLRKNTLKRKILTFFVGFSAFCFSAMTQMSMSMEELSSESFSFMIISIGLILAFMSLLLSLSEVVKSNAKKIAMMKVFGYTEKECFYSILGGYRPVSYVGFFIGTFYQYGLLKIMVEIVFKDLDTIPDFTFNYKALIISAVAFIIAYEVILFLYSKKISRQSVKSIMLE